jgi:hypothetical protein
MYNQGQEGQFMAPGASGAQEYQQEQEAYIPRPINEKAQEQSWQHEQFSQPFQQPLSGEKIYPHRGRRSGPRGFAIALIVTVALLALIGGVFGYGFQSMSGHSAYSVPAMVETQMFKVSTSTTPTLIINDHVGTIQVQPGGPGNTVEVDVTSHGMGLGGNPGAMPVIFAESADDSTITVNVGNPSGNFMGLNETDFVVTVPKSMNLQLTTNRGSIDVSNISGQMQLSTDTGFITATQDSLSGPSSMETNTGSIIFDGTVTPGGNYQFITSTGSIHTTLPGDAGFHLDAVTNAGSITSDVPGVTIEQHSLGASAHDDIGDTQGTTISLKTNTGSISLSVQ